MFDDRYIFMTGAPGSKWSAVSSYIYHSPDIDRSDYTETRCHYNATWDSDPVLGHRGAYWGPGMEFGKSFLRLPKISKTQIEAEFDKPFAGKGTKIIRSHIFSHHLDFLKQTWPDVPIVMVYRTNDACLGWWIRCGQFNMSYPNYQYYSNLEMMSMHIDQQNQDILDFAARNNLGFDVRDNFHLCETLKIAPPPEDFVHQYQAHDIQVAVA
jgi:hypothetical protein